MVIGGEGGIRTHVTVARKPHFECGAFDHSATSPQGCPIALKALYGQGSAAASEDAGLCQAPFTARQGMMLSPSLFRTRTNPIFSP